MSKSILKTHLVTSIILVLAIMSIPLITVAYTMDMSNEENIVEEENEEIQEHSQPLEGNTVLGGQYDHLFLKYSAQYGVSYQLVRAISLCENTQQDTMLRAQLTYSFTNEKLGIYEGQNEESYGLAMINLHYNPTITLEQATSPSFSIEFLSRELSNGNHSWWACYTSGKYKNFM